MRALGSDLFDDVSDSSGVVGDEPVLDAAGPTLLQHVALFRGSSVECVGDVDAC